MNTYWAREGQVGPPEVNCQSIWSQIDPATSHLAQYKIVSQCVKLAWGGTALGTRGCALRFFGFLENRASGHPPPGSVIQLVIRGSPADKERGAERQNYRAAKCS